MADRTDVFIIGGGPAGLAAAIAARKKGFEVIVADASAPPIDKACGEGLMPDCVDALAALGITIQASDGYPFRGIRFLDSEISAEAYFPAGPGIGVRRTALHQKMAEHAAVRGACLLWQRRVSGLCADGVLVDGSPVRARWIIGADGGNSVVRRWSGLDSPIVREQRFAYRRHYRVHPWTDSVEIHWGQNLQVYVTPVGPYEVGAAVISRNPHLRLDDALREFPALAVRFRDAAATSTERGGITSMLRLGRVYAGRVALIGDASGGVDAITGEGLGLAFRQAIALAGALAAGDLARYQAAHQRLARRPSLMARLMLMLDARSSLRRRATRILAREPQIFARILAAHVGALSAADLAATGVLLGWHMLTA